VQLKSFGSLLNIFFWFESLFLALATPYKIEKYF
jgi:hypothetical protein